MALIKSVRGFTPKIGKDTFLADNATIIGDVEIGEGLNLKEYVSESSKLL